MASIHLDPDTKHAAEPVNPVDDLYSVLEGSAIIPYIESKLQVSILGSFKENEVAGFVVFSQ